jgi:predicted ATPase
LFISPKITLAPRARDDWLADQARLIDNLRAALDWAFASDGDLSIGVSLTAALAPFWVQMSAMADCRRYVERALAHLDITRDPDGRIKMTLNAALGAALTYTTGPVPETVAAWTTTRQLAEALNDTEYRLRALRGLWSYRMNAGDYRAALTLANDFCELAERQADPQTLRAGDRMAALILHYLGEQADARRRIEWTRGRAVTVAPPPATRFMLDQNVAAHALLARILWLQGFADQARQAAETALVQAQTAGHAISVCHALGQAVCPVALWTGDLAAADRLVTMLIDLASQNALEGWVARGRCLRGVLLIRRDLAGDGTALLRTALPELRTAGSTAEFPLFRGILARGLGLAGQLEDGRAAIEDAIQRSASTGELWCAAELLRVKAELLVLSDAAQAESCFRQALATARQQGTLAWELRAAIGLARLHRNSHRAARAPLASVYQRFTEGFETADLKAARLLLEEPA